MNNKDMYRRYEILIPPRFNDGNAVPEDLIATTLAELEHQFVRIPARRRIFRASGATRARPIAMTSSASSWMCPMCRKIESSSWISKSG